MKQLPWRDMISAASGDVRRLSSVVRYSSIPVSVPENVAEHSYWVSLYAMLIHSVMRPDDHKTIGALALRALIHDLAECVTGDVVRTFKYSSQELKQAIDKAEEKIIQEFPSPIRWAYKTLPNLEVGNTRYVDAVVKAADFMSLHQYMIREELRGNLQIRRFYLRMEEDLRTMKAKLEQDEDEEVQQIAALYHDLDITAQLARHR